MKWIDIKDRQPNEGDEVLTLSYPSLFEVAEYRRNFETDKLDFYDSHCAWVHVDYWMPLPVIPEI